MFPYARDSLTITKSFDFDLPVFMTTVVSTTKMKYFEDMKHESAFVPVVLRLLKNPKWMLIITP